MINYHLYYIYSDILVLLSVIIVIIIVIVNTKMYGEHYVIKPRPIAYLPIRCKTANSIVHKRLEQFFSRHVVYDYSDDRYVYTVTRVNRPDTASNTDYMEITYTQYSSIYDSPTKEITIIKPNKLICITDNYSDKERFRYQYSVQQ